MNIKQVKKLEFFDCEASFGITGFKRENTPVTKEEMLSRFAADASHKTVVAGPVEATALGNIAMQLIASGEISDVWEARRIIRSSCDAKEYKPNSETAAAWDEAYARFCALIGE